MDIYKEAMEEMAAVRDITMDEMERKMQSQLDNMWNMKDEQFQYFPSPEHVEAITRMMLIKGRQ